jgi:hypothetical protein
MTENLPAGVHLLSAESQAALARARARSDAIVARHAKPERLAAATIGSGALNLNGDGADF